MNWLGFITGYSLLDVWTLVHLCFWLFIGSCLYPTGFKLWKATLVCFGLSLAWEVFEHFAFQWWPHLWHDPESWFNAWISDPLTVVAVPIIYWLLAHRRRRQQQ